MIHITVIFNSSRQVTWKKTVTGSGAKCNGNAKFLSIDLHQVRIQDYSKGGGGPQLQRPKVTNVVKQSHKLLVARK